MPKEIRLSPSIAKILIEQTPKHAWQQHWLLGGTKRDPTPEMERGIVLDALILGGAAEDRIFVVDANDWRTKAAQEQREKARSENLVPVLEGKLKALENVAAEVSKRIADRGIKFDGETQKKVEWTSNGVLCKGKLDHFILGDQIIFDLKCVEDASPAACQKAVANWGYDIQYAAYVEGIEALHPELVGRVRMAFLFCEVEPPYAMTIGELAGSFRDLGQRKWQRAVKTWGECLKTGVWPEYPADVLSIEAPAWQLSQYEQEDMLREFELMHKLKPGVEV